MREQKLQALGQRSLAPVVHSHICLSDAGARLTAGKGEENSSPSSTELVGGNMRDDRLQSRQKLAAGVRRWV
jgi:hypothetical protein